MDQSDPVARVAAVLGTFGSTVLTSNDHWEEVRCCSGSEITICVAEDGTFPIVNIVRGGQMYRLCWETTELPPMNISLVARPNI